MGRYVAYDVINALGERWINLAGLVSIITALKEKRDEIVVSDDFSRGQWNAINSVIADLERVLMEASTAKLSDI